MMRIAVLAGVVSCVLLSAGVAGPAGASVRQPTEIPAESLDLALRTLAKDRHLQVLYRAELVQDVRSPGATGSLTPDEALTKVLSGTGLSYKFLDANTVTVVSTVAAQAAATGSGSNLPSGSDTTSDNGGGKNTSQDFLMAQVDQSHAGPSSVEKVKEDDSDSKKTPGLEEILVTGSRLARAGQDGPQDVHAYTKQQIDQSGQTNVADFLNTLPAVSTAVTEVGLRTFGGSTTVSLRGLPIGATLILINGRRVETSGSTGGFFDLNNIPLAAVERVEVIADGSSAIYGSDAIAGVVNIILRKDFTGFDTAVSYGRASGTDEFNTSLSLGQKWDKGAISLIGSYQTRTELTTDERRLTASNDYSAFGGANNNVAQCSPGNIFSADGVTPLPGLGSATFAAVPTGSSGAPNIAQFAGTAGRLNDCSIQSGASLIPATHRAGVFLQGNYRITDSVEIFGELLFSHVEELGYVGYPGLFGVVGFQSYTASAENPYNPFGTTVGVAESFRTLPRIGQVLDTDFVRPLLGARGKFGSTWDWEITARDSRDFTHAQLPNYIPNAMAIQNALNSSNPTTALNPFTAGPAASSQLLKSLFSDGLIKYTSRGQALNAVLRGTLIELPAGPLQVAIGGEYDRDALTQDDVNDGFHPLGTRTDFTRNSGAIFSEARVPLLASRAGSPGTEIAAITLAERYDHYSDFGAKSTPQFGVELRPYETILIRGTYAQAFRAPDLQKLYAPLTVAPAVFLDPRTGQIVQVNDAYGGGNSGLRPETGRSDTLGVVWSSKAADGLQVSMTNWRVHEDNVIQNPTVPFLVDNEALFPNRIVRDSSGNITSINATYINFGRLYAAGVDYQLVYRIPVGSGTITPTVSATQVYKYTVATTPNSPPVNALAQAQGSGDWSPRIRATLGLTWSNDPVTATLDSRYVGRYRDYDALPDGHFLSIGNFWTTDANVRYNIGGSGLLGHSIFHKSYIELGGVNIFNTGLQFSNYGGGFEGYDPSQGDIRSRFIYLRVSASL